MKKIYKCIFFIAIEIFGINKYFRYRNRGKIKVLMFHSISTPGRYFKNSVSESSFTRQIVYLSKHFALLKMTQEGEFEGFDPTKVNVLLTFDDGFKDNFTLASPLLSRIGISAVFFVIGECLQTGDPPTFIKDSLGQESQKEAYRTFTSVDAKRMLSMGMSIGSHSQKHSDYTKITFERSLSDAIESKMSIEKELGVSVPIFAFPWGKYPSRLLNDLNTVYRRIFITEHGFNTIDDFVFYRNEVANLPHLKCAASGALDYFSCLIHGMKTIKH